MLEQEHDQLPHSLDLRARPGVQHLVASARAVPFLCPRTGKNHLSPLACTDAGSLADILL